MEIIIIKKIVSTNSDIDYVSLTEFNLYNSLCNNL